MKLNSLPHLIKGLILVILLGGGCAPAEMAAPTPTPADISLHLSWATRLAAEKEYSAALTVLEEAARLDPSNPQPAVVRGQIYLEQHRWEPAQEAFSQTLARQTDNYTATLGLARALLEQTQHVRSRQFWRQAIELNDNRPEGWLGLGQAHLAALDYAQAKDAFRQSLARGPDAQAQWFLAALTIPSDFKAGLAALTEINESSLQKDYLLATLEPFGADDSQTEVAAITGIALIQLEEWELAHYALTTATQLDPNQAQTWAFLGHTQAELGLPAVSSFKRAKELDPELVLPLYFEGIYLRKKGLYDLAINRFLKALKRDPGNLAVALETALALTEKGDFRSAEAWYRSVAEAEPDSAVYQQLLTEFYVDRSYRVEENGLSEAERLVELAPDSARAFDLLGWARFQTGAYAGAEEALRQAIALDPTNISARYHLGRLLKHLRRDVEAQAEFTHVIDWDTSGHYRERILQGNY
jgi:tetratricopeptide (TPR) repeat protein